MCLKGAQTSQLLVCCAWRHPISFARLLSSVTSALSYEQQLQSITGRRACQQLFQIFVKACHSTASKSLLRQHQLFKTCIDGKFRLPAAGSRLCQCLRRAAATSCLTY